MAEPYVLYYYPIPARGEFIQLILEVVGHPYEEVRTMPEMMQAKADPPNGVHFAHPILKISETLSLSQTPVICAFLARRHGLMPEGERNAYVAIQIDHTVHDVLVEVQATHHPIEDHGLAMPARIRRVQSTASTFRYVTEQHIHAGTSVSRYRRKGGTPVSNLIGFASIHLDSRAERSAVVHSAGKGPFLFGDKMCYVDLSLAFLLEGLEHSFPKYFQSITGDIPHLLQIRKAVQSLESVKKYRKSERWQPFSNGIFRYKAELDEDTIENIKGTNRAASL